MITTITLVYHDDGAALYVGDALAEEGNSISALSALEHAAKAATQIHVEYITADQEWIESIGRFPASLADVVEDDT